VLNNFQGDVPPAHGGGEDLAVNANGQIAFQTAVPEGTRYTVTVKSSPTGPAQTCAVANGSAVMGTADANVNVTCTTSTFVVRGTITGLSGTVVLQNNGGGDLSRSASGPFEFATRVASGAPYAVTVKTQPTGQTCSVARGSGTVTQSDVSDVAVTCAANALTYSIGGTVSGLAGTVVLQNNGGDDATVAANGPFQFTTKLANGAPYLVTVKTQPASRHCSVTNGLGAVSGANVTTVNVSCTSVIQRWSAATTWGAAWPDSPKLVHHAYFDASGIVNAKGPAFSWSGPGTAPTPQAFTGFPGAARYGAGPFTGARFQVAAGTDGAVGALTRDMLVCAIVKPDYDPATMDNGTEKTIVAKGIANGTADVPGGGWVLMQMHHHFCFHYQNTDGTTSVMRMAATPTYFADQDGARTGPLNPSYVVVCGGRAGNDIVLAVNNYPLAGMPTGDVAVRPLPSPTSTLDVGNHPMTIGGSDTGDAAMAFGGRIYETAVWNEPATAENIQAKFAAIQGLTLADGTVARYTRNREGAFQFASLDGKYHTTWRSGPRIDPAKGFLFGGQGWNRVVSEYTPADPAQPSVFVPTSEELGSWTKSGAADVQARQAVPPGDSEQNGAAQVILPAAGDAISTPLAGGVGAAPGFSAGFDAAGQIQGQIWLNRPASTTGTLRVQVSKPASSGSDHFDIDLSGIPAETWTRVWLYRSPGGAGNELTTDGGADPGTVSLVNAGTTELRFLAWGLDLTQLGGGAELGALDPGPEMYDGSLRVADFRSLTDVLYLPALVDDTSASGFCLSVDVQPVLTWDAPYGKRRTLVAWTKAGVPESPAIYSPVGGSQICFFGGAGAAFNPCFSPTAPPLGWTPGTKHNVKGCVSAAGDVSIYADDALMDSSAGATVLNLSGGALRVGSDGFGDAESPWHGFVSKVLACFDTADNATSCQ
jgi:hypothetical protein